MIRPIVPYIPDVPHLSLIAVPYPFDLFRAVVLYPVHLLRVILSQTLELLTLVLFNVVQHLIDLLGSRCDTHASAAETPSATAAPTIDL